MNGFIKATGKCGNVTMDDFRADISASRIKLHNKTKQCGKRKGILIALVNDMGNFRIMKNHT